MSRLVALFLILGLTACYPTSNSPDYSELDIETLQALMEQEELTSERLTQFYLDRIYSIDRNGPALNSIIEVNPDALEIARDLDRERAMATIVSGLTPCAVLDYKMTVLGHNTVRGAAGGSLLNAELAYARGYLRDGA